MSRPSLCERIENANRQGRMARIPFITAGFPTLAGFLRALRELDENGADIIEIGVPFSDPVADGPVVEEASRRALEAGVSVSRLLRTLADLPFRPRAGCVLMGYYNPFLRYGLERFAAEAAAAGVQGCIVPDLPLEEDGAMRGALSVHGMDLIALVGPNTPAWRMSEYAATARGYVYVVSAMGVTGVREGLPPEAAHTIARARRAFSLPIALGFGIQSPEQLRDMPVRPDAVVFGSALVKTLDSGGSAADFMKAWL